ncbi:M20/M25/M40 family metallo-hydrolase [Cryobacterium aureum]|uniref:M20/M25/M40 family metallo-hydrolase n=1 Tax=Cryobacterium aureum TaxID=995037 RepID=UPI000CF434DF|nr:M20/M25/M40 family metallo-hydrolase [Cryobacterium aureum]
MVLVGRVQEYVELETPTGDPVALRRLTDRIAARLQGLGAVATWHEHEFGAHVVCRLAGSTGREHEQSVVLLLHVDTVWPIGQLETMPWRLEGEVAYGPGCFDMKGGIVVAEEALRQLATRAHRPIVVVIVADEEIGSPSARDIIEQATGNARAVLGFEPPHPDGALKTARWGSTRVRVSVVGRAAHAALDATAGTSAIDELVDQLIRVRELTTGVPGVLCNIGTISGGTRTNIVSDRAHADIGLRFQDSDVELEMLHRVHDCVPVRPGAEVFVQILSNRPAWSADGTHDDLLELVARAGRQCGQEITGRPAQGAADTNFTGRSGIPSVDGLGPLGRGAHALDEQVVVSSLNSRVDLVTELLASL